MNLLDQLFGRSGRPLRRTVRVRLTADADGRPAIETVEGEAISLSPEGSIDRLTIHPANFYHCGCNAELPMGGQCGEPGCGRISCQRCFTRCQHCHKPVCLEHLRQFATDNQQINLCCRCHGDTSRRQLWRNLLSPFIHLTKQ